MMNPDDDGEYNDKYNVHCAYQTNDISPNRPSARQRLYNKAKTKTKTNAKTKTRQAQL